MKKLAIEIGLIMKKKFYDKKPVKVLLKATQIVCYLPLILAIYYVAIKRGGVRFDEQVK